MPFRPRYTGLINKYRDRLPVNDDTRIISLGEGNTPLIRLNNIPRLIGKDVDIYVKFEGLNPTGSFKDRGMTMAVTKVKCTCSAMVFALKYIKITISVLYYYITELNSNNSLNSINLRDGVTTQEAMSPNKYEDKEVAPGDDFLMAELDDKIPFESTYKISYTEANCEVSNRAA